MKLTVDVMADLARGSAFLGTGGGGDPYAGRLYAEHMVQTHGAPELVHPSEIPDDANVFLFGMIGAPTVLVEKLMAGPECDLTIDLMEKATGRKADYIISAEIGGLNSVIPVAMAARRGIPIVDADGMGRAFPEIQMTTFNVYGVPISPIVIVNDHLESVVIRSTDAKSGENFARAVAIQMGLSAMLSAYPMTGKQVKDAAVHGTLSLALGIGKAIREGRHEGDPVDSLLNYLRTTDYYNKCAVLFDGKVVDLLRETTRGFSIGKCVFEALDGSGRRMDVKFQNEHLIARDENGVKTIVPDLICMVDRETAEPVTTEGLKYGQRLKVIGVSAAPMMRTDKALACFGPHAFGLDEPFEPIESLLAL